MRVCESTKDEIKNVFKHHLHLHRLRVLFPSCDFPFSSEDFSSLNNPSDEKILLKNRFFLLLRRPFLRLRASSSECAVRVDDKSSRRV